MSLVNDMLRDLDQRRRLTKNLSTGDEVLPVAPVEKKNPIIVFSAIALVVAIAALAGAYSFFNGDNALDLPSLGKQGAAVVAEVVQDDEELGGELDEELDEESEIIGAEDENTQVLAIVPVSKILVNNIVLDTTDFGVRIRWYLSQAMEHEMSVERGTELDLSIKGVQLNTVLPAFSHNRRIERFNMSALDNRLNFSFSFVEDSSFQSYILREADGVQLVLDVVIDEARPDTEMLDNYKDKPDVPSISEKEPVEEPVEAIETNVASVDEAILPQELAANPTSQLRKPRELPFSEQDRDISQKSLILAQSGQMQKAYQGLNEFILDHPEAHQSRETLITLLLAQREYAQAKKNITQGLVLAPNFSGYKKLQARLFMRNGKDEKALDLLAKRRPLVADDHEYHALLAALYQKLNDHINAVSSYTQLIRYDQDQAAWWVGLAISSEAMGNEQQAVEAFSRAIRIPNLSAQLRRYSQQRIKYLSH